MTQKKKKHSLITWSTRQEILIPIKDIIDQYLITINIFERNFKR